MVGVAVKVTLVPKQSELSKSLETMLTLAAKIGLTVLVIVLEVAGEPVAHVAVDVITTETAALLGKLVVV